jgi:hypothetical protein
VVARADGLGLQKLAAIIVASASYIVELKLRGGGTQGAGVQEGNMANCDRLVGEVFNREPFADQRSRRVDHIMFRYSQAFRLEPDVELKFALIATGSTFVVQLSAPMGRTNVPAICLESNFTCLDSRILVFAP